MNAIRRASRRRVPVIVCAVFGIAAAIVASISAVAWHASVSGRADAASAREAASAWNRLPLPWRPSPDELYPPSTECATCHPTQTEQWKASTHSRSAHNPLVHASICGRCHAPLGTQLDPMYQLDLYDGRPMPDLPAAAAEGITCLSCHARSHTPEEQVFALEPTWPNWRATDLALEIQPFDAALGAFGTGEAGDPLPVANDSHTSEADPRIESAELCGTCHSAVMDKSPLAPHCGAVPSRVALLTTYDEWAAGPYAESGQTCQSCHMAEDRGQNPAAIAPVGTTYDETLPARLQHDHAITGLSSDYLATGPEVDLQEERVAARLEGAAMVDLAVPASATVGSALTISMTVTNSGAGHQLPTGFAYWSEAWFELSVTDAMGQRLFASGDLDEEEWLRDEFNPRVIAGTLDYDAYLVSLRARLLTVGPSRSRWMQPDGTLRIPAREIPANLNGTPIIGPSYDVAARIFRRLHPAKPVPIAGIALQEGYVLRFADTILRRGIPPLETRQATYVAPIGPEARFPLRVSARLLIRSQWPWMLGNQEELPTPRPRPRIYEVASVTTTVQLREP